VFNYSIPAEVASQSGHRGTVDLNNPLCDALVADLARHKTYVDPTLVVFRNMILLPDVPEVRDHADNQLVPQRRRELAKYLELTGKLHRSGVKLLVGTDSPEPNVTPGFSLHQELELLVASGLSPAAALQAATLHNAQALDQENQLGSIAEGKLADLVVLTANPLDDIRNTRKIEAVVRGGKVCQPAELLNRVPKK
jgi:imidazolonepropionase-like amidohydrolase